MQFLFISHIKSGRDFCTILVFREALESLSELLKFQEVD